MNHETFEKRREALRRKIHEAGLGALIVSLPANRYYLSGFELHDPQLNESSGWLLITADGPDWLLTDPRFLDMARRLWDEPYIHIYRAPKYKDIREFLHGLDAGPIGFEGAAMPYQAWLEIRNGLDLRPIKGLVESLRIIKEPLEISLMRRSCALNHRAVLALEEFIIPGKTEAELAWDVEKFYREHGASELAFATIVGIGPNAALPHAIPGSAKVREDELVLVDMGCRLADYCSDQTRTYWVGDNPSPRFKSVLAQVQEAQEAGIKALGPGISCAEAYHAARKIFENHGVEEYFTHSLGHGIGLETHEAPSLGPTSQDILQPGMVVTVEPGLYYSEWGGVRWEHMVLITEDGAEVL